MITDDLLSNPQSARIFANNPDEYLSKQNIKFKIYLDDADKDILLCYADEDIRKAINERNLNHFCALIKEKGYWTKIQKWQTPGNIRKFFRSDEDYNNYITYLEANGLTANDSGLVLPVYKYTMFYDKATGIEDVIAFQNEFFIQNWVALKTELTSGATERMQAQKLREEIPVFKIWTDNSKQVNYDMIYSELINKQLDEIMKLVIMLYPEIDPIKAEGLRNIYKTDLEFKYGIRRE